MWTELASDEGDSADPRLMEELDHLVRLDALFLEEAGPKTFVTTADVSGASRYKATPRGKRIAESPRGLAIEVIV